MKSIDYRTYKPLLYWRQRKTYGYTITIPKEVSDALNIDPDDRFEVSYDKDKGEIRYKWIKNVGNDESKKDGRTFQEQRNINET